MSPPRITVLMPTIKPTVSETLPPCMMRTQVSRPNSSVPNQCFQDGICMRSDKETSSSWKGTMNGPAITKKKQQHEEKEADVGNAVLPEAAPDNQPIAGLSRRRVRQFSFDSEFLGRASHR